MVHDFPVECLSTCKRVLTFQTHSVYDTDEMYKLLKYENTTRKNLHARMRVCILYLLCALHGAMRHVYVCSERENTLQLFSSNLSNLFIEFPFPPLGLSPVSLTFLGSRKRETRREVCSS